MKKSNIIRLGVSFLAISFLFFIIFTQELKGEKLLNKIASSIFGVENAEDIDYKTVELSDFFENQRFEFNLEVEEDGQIVKINLNGDISDNIMYIECIIEQGGIAITIPVYVSYNTIDDFAVYFQDPMEENWYGFTDSDLEFILEESGMSTEEFITELSEEIVNTEDLKEAFTFDMEIEEVSRKSNVDIKGINTTEVMLSFGTKAYIESLIESLDLLSVDLKGVPETLEFEINYDKNYTLNRFAIDFDQFDLGLGGELEYISFDQGKVDKIVIPSEVESSYINIFEELYGTISDIVKESFVSTGKMTVSAARLETSINSSIVIPSVENHAIVLMLDQLEITLENDPDGSTYDYENSYVVAVQSGDTGFISYDYYVTLISEEADSRGIYVKESSSLGITDVFEKRSEENIVPPTVGVWEYIIGASFIVDSIYTGN